MAAQRERRLNLPNALCLVRLIGAPVLLVLAWFGMQRTFLALFIVLELTDTVDGRIARWLNQRSTFGARLDTVADVLMYTLLVPSFWIMRPDVIEDALWFLVGIGLTYAGSVMVSLVRFGRWPSFHNRLAKISWGVLGIGVVCVLLEWASWPLLLGLVCVMLANVDAMLIGVLLRSWRADVASAWHADTKYGKGHRPRRMKVTEVNNARNDGE